MRDTSDMGEEFESPMPDYVTTCMDESSSEVICLERSRSPSRDIAGVSRDSDCNNQRSSRFLKWPVLGEYFEKVVGGNKTVARCLNCAYRSTNIETNRLKAHLYRCTGLVGDARERAIGQVTDCMLSSENDFQNLCLAEAILDSNSNFTLVGYPSFKKFVVSLHVAFKAASRQEIAARYVPYLAKKVRERFDSHISHQVNYMSVEFDHWQELCVRSLLGVTLTCNDGLQHVGDITDVSCDGHGHEAIVAGVHKSLIRIPPAAINSFISDSASSCKKAREELVKLPEYNHCIQHRCLAHMINSMINRFFSKKLNPELYQIIEWASRIAATVSRAPLIVAKLRDQQKSRVQVATKTRWYSLLTMLESLIEAKEVVIAEIHNTRSIKRLDDVDDSSKWMMLEVAIKYLKPLVDCIAQAEKHDGFLGEAVGKIIKLGKTLIKSDWNNPIDLAMTSAYLFYFNPDCLGQDEFGLFMAAYALDHRHHCNYLTQDGIDEGLRSVINVGLKSGIPMQVIETSVISHYNNFCEQRCIHPSFGDQSVSGPKFWLNLKEAGVLQTIALRISYLRSSSANIERMFSQLKYIQGNNRTRISIALLRDIITFKLDGKCNEFIKRTVEPPACDPSTTTDDTCNPLVGWGPGDEELICHEFDAIVRVDNSFQEDTDQVISSVFARPSQSATQSIGPFAPSEIAHMKRLESKLRKYIDYTIIRSGTPPPLAQPISQLPSNEEIESILMKAREQRTHNFNHNSL